MPGVGARRKGRNLDLRIFAEEELKRLEKQRTEYEKMLKGLPEGKLSLAVVKGKKYYQIANGQISEGTTITLREVRIGDAVLHNVDASVVKSQKAPLLLGQSAMERFGTITIDNQNNKLIIKH